MRSVTSRPPGRESSAPGSQLAPVLPAGLTMPQLEQRPNDPHLGWEARWIIPAAAKGAATTTGPPDARVDFYDVETLRPDRTLKLRGGTRPELKMRVDAPQPFERDGIGGIAEQWRKRRVSSIAAAPRFRWIRVPKQIWRRPGFEIVRIDLEKGWWSIAVDLDRFELALASRELAEWRPLLRTEHATSYCAWLIGRLEAGRAGFRPGPCSLPQPRA